MREKDVLAILFDEYLLGVEADLSLFLGETKTLAVILRDVEDGLEVQRDIRVEMQLVLILLPAVGQELKESVVLLIRDLILGLGPKGLDEVDSLSIDCDGEIDEIRVLLYDLLYLCLLYELAAFLLDVHDDLCASDEGIVFFFRDLEGARAI